MRNVAIGILASCLLIAGCAPPRDGGDGAELATMIQEAQKAGWQKHDAAGYFAVWGDDGKKIEGRTATPDKFDTVLTRQQFEDVTRMRLAVPAPYGIMVTFSDV